MAYWTAKSLDAVPPHLGDSALRDLAMRYAHEIDGRWSGVGASPLEKFGPKLSAVLISLGCAPTAAAAGAPRGGGGATADDLILHALRTESPAP